MLLSPEEFARAWGADALVRLASFSGTPIPNDGREFLMQAGLPALIRYFPPTAGVITFRRLASGLAPLLGEKTVGPPLPSEWSVYWIVGDEFFCNGAAWWCVHGPTGRVDRIDIAIESPIDFANSSVVHLASAVLAMSLWSTQCSRAVEKWPSEVDRLKRELADLDPTSMQSDRNLWPAYPDFIRSEGPVVGGFEKGSRAEGERAFRTGPW
jgi:SUKH-4 immunity protein